MTKTLKDYRPQHDEDCALRVARWDDEDITDCTCGLDDLLKADHRPTLAAIDEAVDANTLGQKRAIWRHPADCVGVQLPGIEQVAAVVHAAWMTQKRASGVKTRRSETDEELMVDYAVLSEAAKELDRSTVRAVYSAINALGAPTSSSSRPTTPEPVMKDIPPEFAAVIDEQFDELLSEAPASPSSSLSVEQAHRGFADIEDQRPEAQATEALVVEIGRSTNLETRLIAIVDALMTLSTEVSSK